MSFENTERKGEIAHMSNFSFSHSVFYPLRELSPVFIKFEIVVCKVFQFGRTQKYVIWEDCIENFVKKGAIIALSEEFHLFLQCFPKAFFFNV